MITAGETVRDGLCKHTIVAIIRGAKPGDVIDIVEALYAGGIYAVEITLNSDNALALIRQLSDRAKDRMLVGNRDVAPLIAVTLCVGLGRLRQKSFRHLCQLIQHGSIQHIFKETVAIR